ncbi:response regulator transcription factor [Pedobacter sp. ISL-68]|uniref:LytR/AlgR family response regulator transcription factor n=1 Tax=unclassified Pedobacter TaxID=2628915 RepID=UPI001BE8E098|nr:MULTISPECIES: LytTR family DNA-binding domain-containing protein [unclassified Pedobacter]MBT2562040.1 response regulator transcription factor [Pedobacter sp. ISL-64]MBT2591627.1 response regulator transcription factor [Pedobacter sp. ISL-68]
MIKCLAIDDEPLALQLLADNISRIPFLELVASCDDAFAANKTMQEQSIDLIFIDIQMPGITGLQFIQSLVKKPMVIIVTAYKQYALDGFALDVVDYLMKPVSLDRFMKACNKAKDLYELKQSAEHNNLPKQGYMFVNVGYSLMKINYNEITYVEGLKDYIQIHTSTSPKAAVVRMSMKSIEEQLPAYFERIHKSFIVNINKITSIKKNALFIADEELPVSDSYKQVIEKLIK